MAATKHLIRQTRSGPLHRKKKQNNNSNRLTDPTWNKSTWSDPFWPLWSFASPLPGPHRQPYFFFLSLSLSLSLFWKFLSSSWFFFPLHPFFLLVAAARFLPVTRPDVLLWKPGLSLCVCVCLCVLFFLLRFVVSKSVSNYVTQGPTNSLFFFYKSMNSSLGKKLFVFPHFCGQVTLWMVSKLLFDQW